MIRGKYPSYDRPELDYTNKPKIFQQVNVSFVSKNVQVL